MLKKLLPGPFFLIICLLFLPCCSPQKTTSTEPDWLDNERFRLLELGGRVDHILQFDADGLSFHLDSSDVAPLRIAYADTAKWSRFLAYWPADSLLAWRQADGTWPDSLFEAAEAAYKPFVPMGRRDLPLLGLRVAIDPGHTAADQATAELEGKYVRIPANLSGLSKDISFFEANLTLTTGHIIRQRLEALGATVFMTRKYPGEGAIGTDFWTWLEGPWREELHVDLAAGRIDSARWRYFLEEAGEKELLKYRYTSLDLRARTRNIQAFQPHITLIIHYNIDSPNWDLRTEDGAFGTTEDNYMMAFIPGAFMPGELARPVDRLHALRLAIGKDVEASIRLSKSFVEASEKLTGVPPVSPEANLDYIQGSCVYAGEPGVFARNLSLTRTIPGALIYGESLNQDAREEAIRFANPDTLVEGILISSRVREVADAYVQAVREFVPDN